MQGNDRDQTTTKVSKDLVRLWKHRLSASYVGSLERGPTSRTVVNVQKKFKKNNFRIDGDSSALVHPPLEFITCIERAKCTSRSRVTTDKGRSRVRAGGNVVLSRSNIFESPAATLCNDYVLLSRGYVYPIPHRCFLYVNPLARF
ncbi:hypothetical protein V1477_012047 [Vespula maculifrons]|uniref:DUF4817 domain-containing protein n=1 Tax=Vespula maculifrons TaxID=7453 RepID=A0ABD2C0X0_VESMC